VLLVRALLNEHRKAQRASFGALEIEVTVDDPKAYTKPWTGRLHLPDIFVIRSR
jgi:hypothetical protein